MPQDVAVPKAVLLLGISAVLILNQGEVSPGVMAGSCRSSLEPTDVVLPKPLMPLLPG